MHERVASQKLCERVESTLRRGSAQPPGFVLNRAGIDARGGQQLSYGPLPALGTGT